MGKVFKAAIIGALIAVTGGLLLPLVGLASPFVGLFGLGPLTAALVGGAITGGLSALLAPSLDLREVTARLRVSVDPQAKMKWVFGTTSLATDIMWAGRHGEDSQYYSYIIAGAGHLITSYQTLYLHDEAITFSGDAAIGSWTDGLWRQTRLGTEIQSSILDIDASDNFQTLWPLTADGLGMAHYRLRFRVDHVNVQSGVPTRITQVCQGGPVYDPRLDSTRGGVGAHRADDQTTWEWENGGTTLGDNWALVVLRYLLGWKINSKLVIGMGINPDDIDMDQAMAAANVCEALVDGIPRYRVGGILPVTNNHQAIIRQLEGAINGKVATIGGMYYIWAPNDDLTVFSDILEGDLLREVGVDFTPSGPMELLYNTARGRYVDDSVESLYQPRPYPEVEEAAAITEDGGVRLVQHDFSIVQDESIAERVARQIVRRSRFGATWRFAMGPKGLTFQPFSVTNLNCQETNNTNVLVRIINMSFSVSGAVVLEVIEEDSSIYDTTIALGTSIVVADPANFDPTSQIAVTGLAASAITVRGSGGTASDGFQVTWDDPGAYVQETEVQYKETGDTDYIAVPATRIDFQTAIIIPLDPNTQYDIRARHITRAGVVGLFVAITQTTGTDGTDIVNPPDFVTEHVYDDLDTTTLAAAKSRYAMLTARATNTTGSQNNFQNTDAILINKVDFNDKVLTLFYGTIRVGTRITYQISPTRWYLFEVDETFDIVGTGAAEAYKFGVTLIFAQDNNPTVNIGTAAGTSVKFQFGQGIGDDNNLMLDPDFDLTDATIVLNTFASEIDASFWDNVQFWAGLKNMTAPSSSPAFGSWGWTFNAGTGPNSSNTITLENAIPNTSGFVEAWLVSKHRIRTALPAFDIKVRWVNDAPTPFNDFLNLRVRMIGYNSPRDNTAQVTIEKVIDCPYSDGTTYQEMVVHLEGASNINAQYWEFRIGYRNISSQVTSQVTFDSIFVYATPVVFGAQTYVQGASTKLAPGLVPEADQSTDATLVLQGDGTWVANTGGAAPVDSVFGRTGVVSALQADYDAFFLTPAEGNAAYAALAHTHETFDRASSVLGGANVFSNIVVTDGIVSAIATRALTAANVGAAATSHTHAESDIIDGTILARLASAETITNLWQFDNGVIFDNLGTQTVRYQDASAVVGYDTDISASRANFLGDSITAYRFDRRGEFFVAAGGNALRILDPTGADNMQFEHNGTDAIQAFFQTVNFELGAGLTGDILVTGATRIRHDGGVLQLLERASAPTDTAAYGQFWVRNDGPNTPMFTDDVGTDFDLTAAGSLALGGLTDVNLTGIVTGALLYKSAGDWLDTPGLTWDGTFLQISSVGGFRIGDTGLVEGVDISWEPANNRVLFDVLASGNMDYWFDGGSSGSTELALRRGLGLQLWDSANTDTMIMRLGITDLSMVFAGTVDWNITGLTGSIKSDATLLIQERANAEVDAAAYGQFWVRTATPNEPYYTNDAGDDQLIDPGVSTINVQNANYTLVWSDKGKTIHKTSGGAGETYTIPANGSVAWPTGTLIAIQNDGGGDLTVAITTDTLTGTDGVTGSRTLGNDERAVIQKMTATGWKYMASDL